MGYSILQKGYNLSNEDTESLLEKGKEELIKTLEFMKSDRNNFKDYRSLMRKGKEELIKTIQYITHHGQVHQRENGNDYSDFRSLLDKPYFHKLKDKYKKYMDKKYLNWLERKINSKTLKVSKPGKKCQTEVPKESNKSSLLDDLHFYRIKEKYKKYAYKNDLDWMEEKITSKNPKVYLTTKKPKVSKSDRTCPPCGQGGTQRQLNRIIGGSDAVPHSYPWIVRILGGCSESVCGGSLVSRRIIATAFHCTANVMKNIGQSCDHSDGKTIAIVGAHDVDVVKFVNNEEYRSSLYTIPIIDVKSPPHAGFKHEDTKSHDFAIMILEKPVQWNEKVHTI